MLFEQLIALYLKQDEEILVSYCLKRNNVWSFFPNHLSMAGGKKNRTQLSKQKHYIHKKFQKLKDTCILWMKAINWIYLLCLHCLWFFFLLSFIFCLVLFLCLGWLRWIIFFFQIGLSKQEEMAFATWQFKNMQIATCHFTHAKMLFYGFPLCFDS